MRDDSPGPARRAAFGAPGIPPRWTSGAKEGVGTAYSTGSRIWFTLARGILTEVFYPTIDRPQTRDLQYLVTDGETFFHEERRDLPAQVEPIDPDALGYRVESTDPAGRYRLVKEVICDPHQPVVLVRTRLEAAPGWEGRLKLFALLAPHVGVGGWGNSARKVRAAGRELLVAWRDRTHLALGADCGFARTSCGYVGASDGWQDLRGNLRMDWTFEEATDGNVAVLGEIELPPSGEFTLGLAFGDGLHAAVTALVQSLSFLFGLHRERFVRQWRRAAQGARPLEAASGDAGRLYRASRNLLLAHEDKSFPGAFIASASIPWGDAKGDEDIGGYHLVWTRDMVQSASGLLACGNTMTPFRALVYLACSQRPDGGFPQNFWIDGTPYWSGVQLDEVAFPIILAWRMWRADALVQFDPWPLVRAAAGFLVRHGPATQQERWEENDGYSPSTLAATIAALVCAADLATVRGENRTAAFLTGYADFLESHVDTWTATRNGTLVPGIRRHYVRINPVASGDDGFDEDLERGIVPVRNRPPGERWEFPAREVIDPGFLELVRYGIRRAGDPLVEDSLRVVDALLKVDTPYGPCWRRYNHDGYGETSDGGPFEGYGVGRPWPLLTGERGHYELAAGRDPAPFLRAMERFASAGGMLPEQVWDGPEIRGGRLVPGGPTGAAMPLVWAHAEYVRLLRSRADGHVFDFIDNAAERYLPGRGRKDLEVWSRTRPVRRVARGTTLRVMLPGPFRLRWTDDEWKTGRDAEGEDGGVGIYYVDIPVGMWQKAPVRFTFFHAGRGEWEGKDHHVAVE